MKTKCYPKDTLYKPTCKHQECHRKWYIAYVTDMGFEIDWYNQDKK